MAEYIVEKKQTSGGWTWAEPKGKLIRCKDCKHWSKPYGWNGFCEHGIPVEEDDYCSHAERKEEWIAK